MKEVIEKIVFMGFTKEQAAGFYKGAWRLGLALFIVGAFGVFSPAFDGFALAGDIEQKIEKKQAQLVSDVQQIKSQLSASTRLLNKSLAAGIATQIRAAALKRCPPSVQKDRDAANNEIDRLQDQHKEFTGERYDIPPCAVL